MKLSVKSFALASRSVRLLQLPAKLDHLSERHYLSARSRRQPSILAFLAQGEFSGAVRKSETVTLRHPVVPVADGFLGGFVRVYRLELRKRNGHLPPLPADLHKHLVLACILSSHP